MVELRTLTIDTKLFTTLWIVQKATLILPQSSEILCKSPFKDSGWVVCCPLLGNEESWQLGMMVKMSENTQIRRLGSGRSKIKSTASEFTSKVGRWGGARWTVTAWICIVRSSLLTRGDYSIVRWPASSVRRRRGWMRTEWREKPWNDTKEMTTTEKNKTKKHMAGSAHHPWVK